MSWPKARSHIAGATGVAEGRFEDAGVELPESFAVEVGGGDLADLKRPGVGVEDAELFVHQHDGVRKLTGEQGQLRLYRDRPERIA